MKTKDFKRLKKSVRQMVAMIKGDGMIDNEDARDLDYVLVCPLCAFASSGQYGMTLEESTAFAREAHDGAGNSCETAEPFETKTMLAYRLAPPIAEPPGMRGLPASLKKKKRKKKQK